MCTNSVGGRTVYHLMRYTHVAQNSTHSMRAHTVPHTHTQLSLTSGMITWQCDCISRCAEVGDMFRISQTPTGVFMKVQQTSMQSPLHVSNHTHVRV